MRLQINSCYCCDECNYYWGHAEIWDGDRCIWTGSTFDLGWYEDYVSEMRAEIQAAAKLFHVEFDLSSKCIYDWETNV